MKNFIIGLVRFLLQVIGTCFVLIWAWKEASVIPWKTWAMVGLITIIVVIIVAVWIWTAVGYLKSTKNKSDNES